MTFVEIQLTSNISMTKPTTLNFTNESLIIPQCCGQINNYIDMSNGRVFHMSMTVDCDAFYANNIKQWLACLGSQKFITLDSNWSSRKTSNKNNFLFNFIVMKKLNM